MYARKPLLGRPGHSRCLQGWALWERSARGGRALSRSIASDRPVARCQGVDTGRGRWNASAELMTNAQPGARSRSCNGASKILWDLRLEKTADAQPRDGAGIYSRSWALHSPVLVLREGKNVEATRFCVVWGCREAVARVGVGTGVWGACQSVLVRET